MKRKRTTAMLIIILVLLALMSLFVGVIRLDLAMILNWETKQLEIMLISRLPRIWAVICTGVGMSVAGMIMQQLCMNKFVSPSTGATICSIGENYVWQYHRRSDGLPVL